MTTLFFVHVPKTAGTSFREAAIEQFGRNSVVQDYGSDSPSTSKLIQQYVYKKSDHWRLYQRLNEVNAPLVCGHVGAKKFMPGIGIRNTIIFFRDPVQRIYSEYQHFLRNQGYKGSFRDFYTQPNKCNVQSKKVGGVPLRAFGVIGLTERYNETLNIINRCYGLNFRELVKNAGREILSRAREMSGEERSELLRLNSKDVELYENACELFDERVAMYQQRWRYAHASLSLVYPKKVTGWAWWEGSDDTPVEVGIRVNGEEQARTSAQLFRHRLSQYSPPRDGHIGFSARINAKPGDRVDCVVLETGQVFPAKPEIVKSR